MTSWSLYFFGPTHFFSEKCLPGAALVTAASSAAWALRESGNVVLLYRLCHYVCLLRTRVITVWHDMYASHCMYTNGRNAAWLPSCAYSCTCTPSRRRRRAATIMPLCSQSAYTYRKKHARWSKLRFIAIRPLKSRQLAKLAVCRRRTPRRRRPHLKQLSPL